MDWWLEKLMGFMEMWIEVFGEHSFHSCVHRGQRQLCFTEELFDV